jgi:hypothetical protein
LTADELELVPNGLDALEYWEAVFSLPRDNGEVFIPGDVPLADDRYWRGAEPSAEESEAIGQVGRCRMPGRVVALDRRTWPVSDCWYVLPPDQRRRRRD